MALTVVNPGQYVLGGISAPTTNISDAFQAGLQSNLNRQSTRQQMQEREQMMRLRTSAEQRNQEMFEMQQRQAAQQTAAAAAARAREAQNRAALENLMGGWSAVDATGMPRISPVAPPPIPGLPAPAGTAPAGTAPAQTPVNPYVVPIPGQSPTGPIMDQIPGVPVASADPTEAFRMAFAARPGLFQGRDDLLYADVSTPPRTGAAARYMTPDSMATRAAIGAMPVAAELPSRYHPYALTNPAEVAERNATLQRQIATTDRLIAETSQAFNAPGSRADPTATIQRINALRQQRGALAAQILDIPPPPRGVLAEEGPDVAGLPPYMSPSYEGPRQGAPEEPAAAEAGLQLPSVSPVEEAFVEAEGETEGGAEGGASRLYVDAPERIFRDADVLSRQQQRLQLLATYYQQIGDLQGLVTVTNQLDGMKEDRLYLDGMLAVAGIQQENFGPLQALLQQRYPGQQVEVRPYTDRSVEIFLDGQSEARLDWDDLATGLRESYDKNLIEKKQALAEEKAYRDRHLFEKGFEAEAQTRREVAVAQAKELLQTQREIAVANNQAEIDRLEGEGRITRIGETGDAEAIFQTVIDGNPVQFVYRPVAGRDPITGAETTVLVATPVDMNALGR